MAEIHTDNIFPPIPVRKFDWIAYRDPEAANGYGATEDAAILDLLETERDETGKSYECDCGCRYEEAVGVLVCRKNNHGKEG